MSEIKPCPCCGCEAEMILLTGINAKYIRCTICGISTEASSDEKALLEIWNRRVCYYG